MILNDKINVKNKRELSRIFKPHNFLPIKIIFCVCEVRSVSDFKFLKNF